MSHSVIIVNPFRCDRCDRCARCSDSGVHASSECTSVVADSGTSSPLRAVSTKGTRLFSSRHVHLEAREAPMMRKWRAHTPAPPPRVPSLTQWNLAAKVIGSGAPVSWVRSAWAFGAIGGAPGPRPRVAGSARARRPGGARLPAPVGWYGRCRRGTGAGTAGTRPLSQHYAPTEPATGTVTGSHWHRDWQCWCASGAAGVRPARRIATERGTEQTLTSGARAT